jgi:hypothetical protein
VTSFEAIYDSNINNIVWSAVDGYSYGSMESKYYNWVYDEVDILTSTGVPDSNGNFVDYNGNSNNTIKQFTDITDSAGR